MSVINTVLNLIYPKKCPLCGEVLSKKDRQESPNPHICRGCYDVLSFNDFEGCLVCSAPIDAPISAMSEMLCPDCRRRPRNFDRAAAMLIHDEASRKIIYDLKYSGTTDNAEFLAFEAARRLMPYAISHGVEALIPVPLHKSRLRERGYNQAEVLARKMIEYAREMYGEQSDSAYDDTPDELSLSSGYFAETGKFWKPDAADAEQKTTPGELPLSSGCFAEAGKFWKPDAADAEQKNAPGELPLNSGCFAETGKFWKPDAAGEEQKTAPGELPLSSAYFGEAGKFWKPDAADAEQKTAPGELSLSSAYFAEAGKPGKNSASTAEKKGYTKELYSIDNRYSHIYKKEQEPEQIRKELRKIQGYTEEHGLNSSSGHESYVNKRILIPVLRTDIIARVKKTDPQKDLTPDMRRKNVADAFMQVNDCPYNTVAIVDDVFTTGATTETIAKILKIGGVQKVIVLSMSIGS